jgi:hypothetical protein
VSKIFISYRHQDSGGHAGWLRDRLVAEFGGEQIFMDIDAIEFGTDFVERINEAVGECDALIAVIGDEWLTAKDSDGRRRLDDPADFVRLEIAAALDRDVRVIPALVGNAKPPNPDDLPESIRKLANRHAIELSDSRWDYDVGRLIQRLRETLTGENRSGGSRTRGRAFWARHRLKIGAAIAVIAAIAVAIALLARGGDESGNLPGLSSEETRLAMSVSPSLRELCSSREPREESSVAAIECQLAGADYLILESFPDTAALAKEQDRIFGSLPDARDPCGRSEWNQTLEWNAGGPRLGQLGCYTADGSAVMSWTNDAGLSVSWAGRSDGDRASLVQAWGRAINGLSG